MLSINTNLSSLIAQSSMKSCTNKLNQAIERMTTGFKINHAKDNAANYAISTNMTTKISSLDVAEDNAAMGLDLISTAEGTLSQIEDKLQRLRALTEQASNGTYGEQSLNAINAECNALVDEINRLYSTTEHNGIKLFLETVTAPDGSQVFEQETSADEFTTFSDLGILDTTIDIYDSSNTLEESLNISTDMSIGEFFELIETKGFNSKISNGQITIESSNSKYLAGALADELGISTQEYTYVESTTTTFDPSIQVITTTTNSTTDYITTTSSSTQTNTVWSTTTVELTSTATVDVTTTTYVSQSNTLSVTTTTGGTVDYEFMEDAVTYSDAEVAAMTSLSSVNSFSSGSTYSISTTAELEKFATLVNSGATTSDVTFVLGADIDLSSVANWIPIELFEGTFDGNGHVIKNLKIDAEEAAFFNEIRGATIQNVGLENVNINGKLASGFAVSSNWDWDNYLDDYIKNCYVTGTIVASEKASGFVTDVGSASTLFIDDCFVDVDFSAPLSVGFAIGTDAGQPHILFENCAVWGESDLDYVFAQSCNEPDTYIEVYKCSYSTYYSGLPLYIGSGSFPNTSSATDPYAGGGGVTTTTSTVSATTTFGELGLTGTNTLSIYDNFSNLIVSLDKDSTLQTALDALNAISEFTATLNNGVLNVTTVGERYLNTSSDFFAFVPVTTNTSTSTSPVVQITTTQQEQTSSSLVTQTIWTTTTTETTRTETTYTTNNINATGSTRFEELGILTPFGVTVVSNGTNSVVNLTKDSTLDDFYSSLELMGFEITESASLVTLQGDGNTYISSKNLQNLLDLSAVSKTNGVRKENTKSERQIYVEYVPGVYAPGKASLQVGTGADSDSQIVVDISFKLRDIELLRDIALDTRTDYLTQIDDMLALVSEKQTHFGATSNRLESVLEEITIQRDNLVSSRSTIRDADIAEVSSHYIQQQILQQASATLLATANQSPSIALQLI